VGGCPQGVTNTALKTKPMHNHSVVSRTLGWVHCLMTLTRSWRNTSNWWRPILHPTDNRLDRYSVRV